MIGEAQIGERTILVIGNGFDIAHGLPTKYPQFLDFVKMYRSKGETHLGDSEFHKKLSSFIMELKHENTSVAKEVRRLMSMDNNLLEHFLAVYEKRCEEGKTGWIDFEAEILQIIRIFEEARSEGIAGKRKLSAELTKRIFPFLTSSYEHAEGNESLIFDIGLFEDKAKQLFSKLNATTRLLEIYLEEFVEKQEIVVRIPEIQSLKNVGVISFNYTNTFERLYGDQKTEYCYIHGKVEENSSIDTCNLVLGIDEYLEGSKRDLDNAFIWFKKFYQRIYKETNSVYIDWLDQHTNTYNLFNKDKSHLLDIYFYGHSLNMTDKDVLQKLILHEGARNHIFYHDKMTMAKQISNLVKLIGEEKLVQMTRGSNRTIEFLPVSIYY